MLFYFYFYFSFVKSYIALCGVRGWDVTSIFIFVTKVLFSFSLLFFASIASSLHISISIFSISNYAISLTFLHMLNLFNFIFFVHLFLPSIELRFISLIPFQIIQNLRFLNLLLLQQMSISHNSSSIQFNLCLFLFKIRHRDCDLFAKLQLINSLLFYFVFCY